MAFGERLSATTILALAGGLGLVAGVGSVAMAPGGGSTIASVASTAAVTVGARRQRMPQAGDHWGGCNDARAAGTAPIYRGEPGYRETMDGDGDGVACEPHYN